MSVIVNELVKKFTDGTDLTTGELAYGRNAGVFGRHGEKASWALTEFGRAVLASGACKQNQPVMRNETANGVVIGTLREAERQHMHNMEPVYSEDLLNQRARARLDAVTAAPSLLAGESDPNGKAQHETGAKLDAGKPRLGLVLGAFANALVEVGKVGTYGAQKYTDNGWLDVPKGKARYTDALLRHVLAETNETHDPDTLLLHAAHAAWNALARLELVLRKRGETE